MPTIEFMSLHRYYIWVTRMKDLFEDTLRKRVPDEIDPDLALADDLGLFLSYWYAALYVVVEGYRDLGLSDPAVDSLLQSPKVDLLRRYRNGVFHFQKNYFDSRLTDLYGTEGTVDWVRELTKEFGRFFIQELPRKV